MPDPNGNLVSVFEEGIKEALIEQKNAMRRSCEGYDYSISTLLEEIITRMPNLIDWIMTTVLTEDRHILLNAIWAI